MIYDPNDEFDVEISEPTDDELAEIEGMLDGLDI